MLNENLKSLKEGLLTEVSAFICNTSWKRVVDHANIGVRRNHAEDITKSSTYLIHMIPRMGSKQWITSLSFFLFFFSLFYENWVLLA